MPTALRMIIVKLTHDNIRDSANQCSICGDKFLHVLTDNHHSRIHPYEDKNIKTSLFRLQKQYSAQIVPTIACTLSQKSNSLVEFDLQVIGSQANTYYWSKQLGISLARNS
ncbi:hypothetical protein T08_11816 [Trichinella sp. T8]|nr:hypothetical protein T08_11816 [Trichinella sp. T8]